MITRWGIEFEYLLTDTTPARFGQVRDFGDLAFDDISRWLKTKPGLDDPSLAAGDLGIRTGYWYLEGEERFHEDGRFRTFVVKGVEIRTPPRSCVEDACAKLLEIEAELVAALTPHELALAIVSYNPTRTHFEFDPPLNAWERRLRASDRGYDGSLVSTMSYGPDINLSNEKWSRAELLDHARKLHYYSPCIVPFSFNSPLFARAPWNGWSVRTHKRAPQRPAVKVFLEPEVARAMAGESKLACPARLASESGRLEFKAFDAMPDVDTLRACCYLLYGLCLDTELPGRSETVDLELYERASRRAFDDPEVLQGARRVLGAAQSALEGAGEWQGVRALERLEEMLSQRRTPAHGLLEAFRATGLLYKPGGLAGESTECKSASLPKEPDARRGILPAPHVCA